MTGCLIHQFDRCIGIELLENLHKIAKEMKHVYEDTFVPQLGKDKEYKELFKYGESPPIFDVRQGDMLEDDWSQADLVLANSTCFDMSLMKKVADKAKSMKKGAFMITLTKKLPTSDL